jgi:hypothetical protein
MILIGRICAGVLLLATAVILSMDSSAGAQKAGPRPVKWDEKKIAFDMRAVPWKKVITWFCDQTDMPFVAKVPPPPGNFTFINPGNDKGKAREYTLTEIHVIINEVLIEQTKHVLVRRENVLTLLPLK